MLFFQDYGKDLSQRKISIIIILVLIKIIKQIENFYNNLKQFDFILNKYLKNINHYTKISIYLYNLLNILLRFIVS
jgi:hypothetical protein